MQRGINLPLENYPPPYRAGPPPENEIFLTSLHSQGKPP